MRRRPAGNVDLLVAFDQRADNLEEKTTKEVIGGYAILETTSRDEALELAKRFLRVHGEEWDIECELRQLA